MKASQIIKLQHSKTGLQIKIILSPYGLRKEDSNLWNLYPGTIHEIVDRPTRKSRRNGDMGIWVNDSNDSAVFIYNFCWEPYFAPKPMQRTKQPFIRTKQAFTRNKYPVVQRTK